MGDDHPHHSSASERDALTADGVSLRAVSDGLWCLMTAGRPTWRDVIDSCQAAGMTQRGLVMFDGHDPGPVELPDNWSMVAYPTRRGIGPMMVDVYNENPEADFYGWLADDTYPRSERWDVKLAQSAGPWKLSYADDGGYIDRNELERGANLSSGLCWGGDLVRTVGWWAIPGLEAAWVDWAWVQLIEPLGLGAYTPQVLVEHRHFNVGGRAVDEHDQRSRGTVEPTRHIYDHWYRWERPATIRRIARALPEDL
jgi:hypothetical protein